MLRNDIQLCTHDTGRYDISRGSGYSSETIWIHWSHSLSVHNGPSMAHILVVTVGPGNESMLPSPAAVGAAPCLVLPVPHWDPHRRELWLDGMLVKRFRQPSPSQEKVLLAFQKEGWPPSIEDPLSSSPVQNPKRRLNQTIRNLNRSHRNSLIRFGGDGTGQRVTWNRIFKNNLSSHRPLLQGFTTERR